MKHLIFIVAYNHEDFITKVLERLPQSLQKEDYEILIIDDASIDKTFELANKWSKKNNTINIKILKNIKNYGYGGNQKLGMKYAIENNFDTLTLLHGDGQYAPEIIHELINFHIENKSSLTLGSRMVNKKDALKGGMPLYKFTGNIILTKIQNLILKTNLSEFHTGYRVYSINTLRNCKFFLNSNNYHFDTEIIIQHISNNYKISEFAIPTYYGDEISYVNGLHYAFNIMKQTILYKLQKFGIFFSEKYNHEIKEYEDKSNFYSTHKLAIDQVDYNSSIIDIGSSNARYLNFLKIEKNCYIKTINKYKNFKNPNADEEEIIDLDYQMPKNIKKFEYIFLLDIIEHLKEPEIFIKNLYNELEQKHKIIASTGNISFLIMRLMLLFGFFNYGNRGILDKTHTRLFTFSSFKKIFINYFDIHETKGIPVPFPLALGDNIFSRLLLKINIFLIKISKPLFAYQIFLILKPKPSLRNLLKETIEYSESIK